MATKRGRTSIAELTATPIATPRLPVPYNLTDIEAAHWTRITASMPAEHFSPSNSDLLAQLCRHIAQSDRLALLIEQICATGKKKTMHFDAEVYQDLLKSQRAESAAILRLARSMRLTQQSIERKSAKLRPLINAEKMPWLDDYTEDATE
jgi:hypothetical protein